jgi:hypothetical protein
VVDTDRGQNERVDTASNCKVADVVADHPVQPSHAVFAGQSNLHAKTQIINAAARGQGGQFNRRVRKSRCGGGAAVLAQASRTQAFNVSL